MEISKQDIPDRTPTGMVYTTSQELLDVFEKQTEIIGVQGWLDCRPTVAESFRPARVEHIR